MELEYNISGRLIKNGQKEPLEVPFKGPVEESSIADFCRITSAERQCKVYVWVDREDYGNSNVFNGGSDYDVVNEDCLLCICDCGTEILRERTNCWNEKIDEVL